MIRILKKKFAGYIGVKKAVAVNSGSDGLENETCWQQS